MDFSMLRDDAPSDGSRPPSGLRSRYRVRDDRIIVEMPNESVPAFLSVWFLFLLGLLGLLAYIFIDSKGNWVPVGMFGGIGGFILAMLYPAVAPRQTVLEIDPSCLTVVRRGLLLASRRNILADSIRLIRMDNAVIVVVSDKEPVHFGLHLSDEERAWVRSILQRVLSQ